MKNHTEESLEEAKLQGKWDREDRKAIQDHYGDDGELNDAYLEGYDPDGKIVPKKKDCPNYADQESIAAPGQTVLCKTHGDEKHYADMEKHYADMKEFFIENLETLQFKLYLPFCSACGSDKPHYIGIIPNNVINLVSFAFCVNCRDEMMLKKNALLESLERYGV
jgi:hypothetical protein